MPIAVIRVPGARPEVNARGAVSIMIGALCATSHLESCRAYISAYVSPPGSCPAPSIALLIEALSRRTSQFDALTGQYPPSLTRPQPVELPIP